MRLRLASYNIRKARGLDQRRDPTRILQILCEIDADIVVLQEADLRLGARPTALPFQLIADATPYHVVPLAAGKGSLGWHGNAILARSGMDPDRIERLDLPGLEPRGAVLAEFGDLCLVGTHLGLLRRSRHAQMLRILQHLGPRARRAVIAGDFNEWSRRRGFEPWHGALDILRPGPSFHAARPVAHLDGFAHGDDLKLERGTVHKTSLSRIASDHLPVLATATTS